MTGVRDGVVGIPLSGRLLGYFVTVYGKGIWDARGSCYGDGIRSVGIVTANLA